MSALNLSCIYNAIFVLGFNSCLCWIFWNDIITILCIIRKLYIFRMISMSDIVSINCMTLILKIIARCDVRQIMTMHNITSISNVSKYNITSITVRHIGLTAILTIMFVSTIINAVILYLPAYMLSDCYHTNQT